MTDPAFVGLRYEMPDIWLPAPQRDGGTEVIVASAQVIGIVRDNQIYEAGQTPPFFVYVPGVTPGEIDTALLVRLRQQQIGNWQLTIGNGRVL